MSSEESKHDQQFYDRFMVIIGILISVTVFLFVIARWIGVSELNANIESDPMHQMAVDSRIAPIAKVAIAGQDFDDSTEIVEVAKVREVMTGPQVYNAICGSCHGSGLAGAPMTDDAPAWAPRIATGMDTLYLNAINGYQGSAGYMPAKGGRVDLSDDEVIAAVEYMTDQI